MTNIHLDDHVTSNFTWGELIGSTTLDKYNGKHPQQGIDNMPNSAQQAHLRYLCEQFLQPLRDEFGPIHINSGFRCAELNKLAHLRLGGRHPSAVGNHRGADGPLHPPPFHHVRHRL